MKLVPLILTLAIAAGAAPGFTQGPPGPLVGPPPAPQVRVPGVSPAGNAALTRLQNKPDPAVPALLRDTAAFRQQMAAALAGPTIDLARLTAALQRGQAIAARQRVVADGHLIEMVRALPPADRAPFLRAVVQQVQRPAAAQGAR